MGRDIRRRPARKTGGAGVVLLVLGLAAGGMLLLIGAVVAVIVLVGPRLNAVNPAGPALGVEVPNARVTEANYEAIKSGSSLADVEAILGVGRPPTSGDFDAVCGKRDDPGVRFTNPLFAERDLWEHAAQNGQLRVWANGRARILVFFHQPADGGGRLVRKVMRHEDGSINSQSGPFSQPTAPPQPAPRPGPKAPPRQPLDKTTYTVAEVLAEYTRDRAGADAKFRGQRITVSGTMDFLIVSEITMYAPDGKGKVQARLDGVATGAIGRKKLRDPIAVTGKVLGYFPRTNMVMLTECTFE